MAIKRDSVNRVDHLIEIPLMIPTSVHIGDEIELEDIEENDIVPDLKDPMAGFGQPDGTNYGDAVFDAMAENAEDTIFDPMG